MSDYFDHVERSLREAVRRRRHLPWHTRLLARSPRPALVAAVVVLGGGTALAATGVLQTGAPVSSEVHATPYAGEGTVIASSVRVLPLRVADPQGGPPWGVRVARTSRGLVCLQIGRVVSGRVGALGRDGAFHDDGAFHPLASGYLSGLGCATEDGRGDGFLNVQVHGIPASGLLDNRRETSGGCYTASPAAAACPPGQLRDVYFGMLGPDATTITARDSRGANTVSETAAPYGAYLVVLPHREPRCLPGMVFCTRGSGHYYTFSPTLPFNEAIVAVDYRDAPSCQLRAPKPRRRPVREPSCPDVGYVAPGGPKRALTSAQLASPVTVHLQRAERYCERGATLIACEGAVPRGYKRLRMIGPSERLLIVDFTARQAVTDFDSHYEIETSIPEDPRHPGFQEACGGTFGPTQTNLKAGQHVRFTTFMNARCHGITTVTVGYVTVNGPSGAEPVPGLPGQSAAIPVGRTTVTLP